MLLLLSFISCRPTRTYLTQALNLLIVKVLPLSFPPLQVIQKLVKQRKDSIDSYKAGGRDDLVAKEQVGRRVGA